MFAPNHHPAMKNVAPVRKVRHEQCLISGLLGEPGKIGRQLIGVYEKTAFANCQRFKAIGSTHVLVVHGESLDEMCFSSRTYYAELKKEKLRKELSSLMT